VVTDPKKVLLALNWVIKEMEPAYKILAKVGLRQYHVLQCARPHQASGTGPDGIGGALPGAKEMEADGETKLLMNR